MQKKSEKCCKEKKSILTGQGTCSTQARATLVRVTLTHAETKGIFYALFVVCSRIQVRQASPAPKLVDKWSESCLQPLAFSLSSNTIRATTKAVLCRESKKNEWKSVFLQSHPHSWRCFRSLLQITNRI